MSDKHKDGTQSTAANPAASDAPKPERLSIAPAMDLSLDAVTVPPPPVSGAASGALSIPRAPRVPTDNKPAKRKRSEDDIFSIFDVEANTASDDIPVSVQQFDKLPPPAPEKPKSQLGTRSEEREVTRSRQIPIDQDLFNLSVGLFSNTEQAPLVAPDMSALVSPGLSDKPAAKAASGSVLDELVLPTAANAPVAPLDSLELLAPKPAAPEPKKSSGPTSNRGLLFGGIAAALLLVGGVFFYMQNASPTTEPTAALQPPTTSDESHLDTRPGQTTATNEAPTRVAKPDTPSGDPAAKSDAPAGSPTPTKDGPDKPTAVAGADKPSTGDKPGTTGNAGEPAATAQPAETAQPAATATTQSLAEAMAAAAPGGGGPAPPPPPPAGNEFNKTAASAALGGAAGAASGCRAAGDPAGVARVSVTFAPSGRATRAVVNGPPYAGTSTGSCVAAAFRSLSIPPFSGSAVTVSKSVSLR